MSEQEMQALKAVRELGVARPRDLESRGIHHEYLRSLVEQRLIVRLARGLYAPAGMHEGSANNLSEAIAIVPHGVVCLVSALGFYEVGTQAPPQTWLAISRRARIPKNTPEWIRIVRFPEATVALGIEYSESGGRRIPVYSLGRTVIDCLKYRRLVGLDVAIEALRDVRQRRLVTMSELADWAQRLGVLKIARPYLEAVA